MILTEKGTLYTGITKDLLRRFKEHSKSKDKGAKYLRYNKPLEVVYLEVVDDRSKATKREIQIKKMSSSAKRKLYCTF